MVDQNVYYLVNLGCVKNLVDATSMGQVLNRAGYQGTASPDQADVLIVNTCGFIGDARQESIDMLRELAADKQPGQMLIAAGCLPQRVGQALARDVPGLDGVISTRRWMDILDVIQRMRQNRAPQPLYHLPDEAVTVGTDERGVLRASVQGTSAYLKIADGCRRPCAFCSIPMIKGTHVSRPPEIIAAEAARLNDLGVQELILISQDTTDYGSDLGLKDGLASLLEMIVQAAPDVPWIRLLYAYPGYVTPRLMEIMAAEERILPYLDMPLQHAHRETLKRMRRPANVEWVRDTIGRLRAAMPEIAIRTTFIVGYPGETDEEFETLLEFLEEMRFDRVGAFTYSHEPGTPSAALPGAVPEAVKRARYDRLMRAQQPISHERNQALVGRTLPVLVEDVVNGVSIGRSYRDAPEIDGNVKVDGELPLGEIVPVRVTGATVYDLIGTVGRAQTVVSASAIGTAGGG